MSAVEVVAEALWLSDYGEGWAEASADLRELHLEQAEVVVAALRAASPQDQADAIGGEVECGRVWLAAHGRTADAVNADRALGPWREVTDRG